MRNRHFYILLKNTKIKLKQSEIRKIIISRKEFYFFVFEKFQLFKVEKENFFFIIMLLERNKHTYIKYKA